MELAGGVAIDMAVETSHAKAWLVTFAVICRIEFLLRKGGDQ